MRIGELAAKTGVTPRALRYYEEMGLLRPDRTTSGQRVYGAAALERVGLIRELYAAGLGSGMISALLDVVDNPRADPDLLMSLVVERERLAERISSLRDAASRLDVLIRLVEHPETQSCPASLAVRS
ncbi:MerR family transcriptional regulator [Actinophytocola sp.]|uniref:MerR family transcriptional regulator n=1 Tax=Actinophytocola sp. TaxID=1872138 RepID=UPI002D590FBC|nr:MerR family transcriptional regulator [Actinophytocola sp.]HYQ68279.1 MerR family transcriptional regulator [Actinophytocola sp.]